MTEMNLITIVATGGQQGTFTVEGAMKSARGFHHAAGELEALHRQHTRHIPQGVTLDQAFLDQIVGRVGGAVVLEALALEIVLKARLLRAAIPFPRGKDGHDHSVLYSLLPDAEMQQADERYQSTRNPAMRASLGEALSASANVFIEWRYMHEHFSVQTSTGEMQHAFTALAEGM